MFSSFHFLDRYRFFLNLTFSVESVLSYFFSFLVSFINSHLSGHMQHFPWCHCLFARPPVGRSARFRIVIMKGKNTIFNENLLLCGSMQVPLFVELKFVLELVDCAPFNMRYVRRCCKNVYKKQQFFLFALFERRKKYIILFCDCFQAMLMNDM